MNAFTAHELTTYYVRVPDERLDLALEILSDIVWSPALRGDDVDSERQVILEEIRMRDDAPEDLVHELFGGAIFPDHAIGREVIGSPATIELLGPEGDRRLPCRALPPEQRRRRCRREPRPRRGRTTRRAWAHPRRGARPGTRPVARDAGARAGRRPRARHRAGACRRRDARPALRRSRSLRARGAQPGARWRDVVTALPGGP